jgi:hypothetical protein
MAEIDDRELATLRGAYKLLDKITRGKKKRLVQEAIHDEEPAYIPEPVVMTEEDTTKLVEAALEKQAVKVKREQLETAFQEKIEQYRLSEKNPDGYTEEGIQKILTLMKERTIPDFEAGVALFEKQNPARVEPPSGYHPTGWNFGARADDDQKLLFEDEDAWLDKEARKVWDEESRKSRTS